MSAIRRARAALKDARRHLSEAVASDHSAGIPINAKPPPVGLHTSESGTILIFGLLTLRACSIDAKSCEVTDCIHTGETEDEDMAHPIQRARQALRNAELHAESAEDGDIETGAGEAVPTAARIT